MSGFKVGDIVELVDNSGYTNAPLGTRFEVMGEHDEGKTLLVKTKLSNGDSIYCALASKRFKTL